MKTLVLTVSTPEYKPDQVPDDSMAIVGKQLDELLKRHFLGEEVVVRCIGSQDHPKFTLDELTKKVLDTGTDKYDPTRMGVGYADFVRRGVHVDFYGEDVKITKDMKLMSQQIWEMHHSAIGDRGFGVHVDLILVYDRAQLDMVMNLYTHHPTSDGFVFKDPLHKREALLGVIKVLA